MVSRRSLLCGAALVASCSIVSNGPRPALAAAPVPSAAGDDLPEVPAPPRGPFAGGKLNLGNGRSWTIPPTSEPSEAELALESRLAAGEESAENLRAAFAYVSGAETPEARSRAERVFQEKLALVRPAVEAARGTRAKGEALLKALHATVLRTFVEGQTYPLGALETGAFNCVSSAIVYDAMAAALGLRTRGAIAPSHAFSYLVDGDARIEVQTTGPSGFDPRMTPAQYRKFLAERHLDPSLAAGGREVPNASLFALALENRVSMGHDGRHGRGGDAEALLRAQAGMERRMSTLAPENETYRRNVVAIFQQLANLLEEQHRGGEAFEANVRAHRATAFVRDARLLESSRRNVLAYAQHWLHDELLPQGRAGAAGALWKRSAELIGCPGEAMCGDLAQALRGAVFEAAKQRDDAGRTAEAWRLVEGLLGRVPLGDETLNVTFFAMHEGDRRWKGDPAGTDGWADAVLARLPCAGEGGPACGDLAGWVAGHYFDSDELRAQSWARRAFRYDPKDPSNRQNYLAATHNAINRTTDQHACTEAERLLRQLRADGLDDPASAPFVADCR